MESISIRQGQTFSFEIDANDTTATSATFYVAADNTAPVIEKPVSLTDGKANVELTTTDTAVPEGSYFYQINVTYSGGQVAKFPEPEDCEDGKLPSFTVYDALDTEVVS